MIGCQRTEFGTLVALVGTMVALVGLLLALVGTMVALVGLLLALVGTMVALIDLTLAGHGDEDIPYEPIEIGPPLAALGVGNPRQRVPPSRIQQRLDPS